MKNATPITHTLNGNRTKSGLEFADYIDDVDLETSGICYPKLPHLPIVLFLAVYLP
jgi:hypothetical protein